MTGISGVLGELTHGSVVDSVIVAVGALLLVFAVVAAALPKRGHRGKAESNSNSHTTGSAR